MEYFRQHKQMTGLLLLPVLLLVWLSFSCQDCFAGSLSDSAQKMHVAMDCCPPGMHDDSSQQMDKSGCDNNYLMDQPVIADQASPQLADFQMVMLPVNELDFEASYPLLKQPVHLTRVTVPFSDRSFSSYRILLI